MTILEAIFVASLCFTLSSTQDDTRKPPSITNGPTTGVIFRENDAVTLTCKAEGIPAVTYAWKRNGEELLNLNHTNIHRGSEGDVTIVEATRRDDGFYQCFATNQYGTALSTVAQIQMAFLDRRSQSNIVSKTVPEGRPFVIEAPRRNSFPPPTHNWEIVTSTTDTNPRTYGQSQRVRSANNGDLHFAYALKEDELGGNIYKNTAFNPNIDVRSGGTYTRVMVTQDSGDPPDFPPNITYFSKSQEVALIGGWIVLECFFSGKPLPEITWSGPRNNLPSGRNSISNYATKLTISNANESDEGDYVCTATNTIGSRNQTLNIRVGALPIFRRESDGPRNVNVTEGDSITFNCSAFANPEATVVWLQNGQPIDANNAPQRFEFSNDNKSLTITEVCRDCVNQERQTDLMVIQCIASNVHGFAFASGYLNVFLRTKVTLQSSSTFVSVDLTKENRFQFTCIGTSDPSTPLTVRWYKVVDQGQELVYNEPPYVYVNDGNLTIYTAPNCTTACDKYLGEYICVGDNGYTRDTATVILNGITDKYCNNELDGKHLIHWSRTLAGKQIFRPCPGSTIGSCSRECFLNASWSQPNCNGCFDNEFKELLERVSDLNATALKNKTVVAEIVSQLAALTNKSEGLTPENLNASVMIINRLAVLRSGGTDNPTISEIESFVQTTSNVLQPINSYSWKELDAVNATFASIILFSVDVYGRSLSLLNVSNCTKKDSDNLVVEAWSLDNSSLPLQPEFPSCSVWDETSGYRISISREALTSRNSSESQPTFNLWGSYYRTINDYLPGNKDFGNINSKVLSLSVDGLKPEEKLKPPVLITLQHNQEKSLSFRRTCAFWNFNRQDWDSTGCSVTSTSLTHTICSCDHLTNFAILMSTTPSYDKALSILSYIGCIISIVALILTIIVYAVTWKQSKSAQATVLLNLCVALIIAYIIFIAGAHKVNKSGDYDNSPDKTPEVGCKVVAVLLHYFFLAAFFIMLAEGVELLIYIIFVFHVRRTIETFMLIASAWVLPLIIVGASLGATKLQGYGHENACWLSAENGLIWAFVGPVLFIVTVNFVILAIVLRWMSKRRSFLANNLEKRDEIRATLWNLSVTCPVLGLGWLFGIFSLIFDHAFFQCLFVIANSLQGLLIFIFHALFHNKKVKEKISDFCSDFCSNYICGCRKTAYEVSSTKELAKKTDKPSLVPMAVHDNEGVEGKDNLHSTGTQNTSIDDSRTLESTH